MQSVLKNVNFRLLWISQIVLSLGDGLMQMGLLEFFTKHGYDVRVETAKMLFAVSVGGVVLGPVAIAYLGRWQRRKVLIFCDALRAVLVIGIMLWLFHTSQIVDQPSLLLVYGLVTLIGILATFYLPARSALVPNLVATDELLKANKLFATSLTIAAVGGRVLGGFVAEKFGVTVAVVANVVTCIAATVLVGLIQMDPHATTVATGENQSQGWTDFKTGMIYLWEHTTALPLVLLAAVFAFLLGILMVVFIGYAKNTLGLGTGGLGYLIAPAVVGAGLGIALLGSGKGSWGHSDWLPFAQLLIAAGALVAMSLTTKIWIVSTILLVLGAVGATVLIYIDAKLQEQVEDVHRGAVFAARGMLTSLTMIVAFWLQFGTAWFSKTPAPTVLFWLGIGSVVAAVLTLLLARSKKATA